MQLFINTPGTMIQQKDECFRLKQGDRVVDISPLKIESMVIANRALISTQAIALAHEHNIDVLFLDGYGDPVGRVWFSKMGSTATIRRKQLEAAENPLGFQLVTDMIARKLDNQLNFAKKLMYARPGREEHFEEAIGVIQQAAADLSRVEPDLNTGRNRLMGLEGTAGKSYFRLLSGVVPERYRFDERSRRPARDPFNACLNYAYGILYSLVEKACILSGLDPFVGFLHTDNYNKKSLVFDLIEPFRIFAEQTIIYLFTGKKIKDEYFDFGEHDVSLNKTGKPVIVDSLNQRLDESVRYRKRNVKRRHIIQHEAHRLANLLLEDTGSTRPAWLEIREL